MLWNGWSCGMGELNDWWMLIIILKKRKIKRRAQLDMKRQRCNKKNIVRD